MVHYDHGMLGATLAVAFGAQRRHGWPVVVLAALAGMFPDWDALSKHISPETYQVGHRVWGHNLFAVTLGGAALGGLGYLIHESIPRVRPAGTARTGVGYWIALGVAVMWTHPFLDLLYCGVDRDADWPVALFWPLRPGRYGRPWIPWSDWGATIILLGGLAAIALAGKQRQAAGVMSLVVLTMYVAVRGGMMRWQ
jgi:hypothetical protein